MPRQRGLGKGLSALLSEQASAQGPSRDEGVREIRLDLVDPSPFQPRRRFAEEALAELAASIREHGVLEPVVVRAAGPRYQLILGERRVRASRLAGRDAIPALVRQWDDRSAMEAALVENLQREDLTPMEEAHGIQQLMEQQGWTQEKAAERIGKSRPHVANLLRLLQLEQEIQALLDDGRLTAAHGKVLLSLTGERRRLLAERAASEGWTVRQLTMAAARPNSAVTRAVPDAHLKAAEADLRKRLGARVRLKGSPQHGRIEIPYRSLEDLERLLELLGREPDGEPPGDFAV
ncbi:MAG: ParB/RepB/Spo0J family partition protein [Firmicutes bacterium]|jgi:ParB family chromosome partitioning protein|nr:ParB/RepB/Spo0J family partition protein [Bacillota bacterium]